MTTIFHQVEDWLRHREPRPHYDQSNDTPEAPVSLAADVKQVTDFIEQRVLGRAAQLESNPVVQALETAALGPQFELVIAGLVKDLAGMFAAPATPAEAAPPEPAPAQ